MNLGDNKNRQVIILLTIVKDFTLISFVVYLVGFLSWTFYLGLFGFTNINSDIISGRYLLAGIYPSVLMVLFFVLLYFFYRLLLSWARFQVFMDKFKARSSFFVILGLFYFFCAIFLVVLYSYTLFPKIEQSFGGGKPIGVSLLLNEKRISEDSASYYGYLNSLNISLFNAEPKKVQSSLMCVIYEDDKSVLIGIVNAELIKEDGEDKYKVKNFRTLILDKMLISGYQTSGGILSDKDLEKNVCDPTHFMRG